MNNTLDGQTKWEEIQWSAIKAFIVNTSKSEDTPRKIAEFCGIIWNNWSEMESWSNFYTSPTGKAARQDPDLKEMLLQSHLWTRLMSFLLLRGELVLTPPEWCLWLGHLPRILTLSRKGLGWRSDQHWASRMTTRLGPYNHMIIPKWSLSGYGVWCEKGC